jgi:hypothetical protein
VEGRERVLGLMMVVSASLLDMEDPASEGEGEEEIEEESLIGGRADEEDERGAEEEMLRGGIAAGEGPVFTLIFRFFIFKKFYFSLFYFLPVLMFAYLCAMGNCATSKASSNWPRFT